MPVVGAGHEPASAFPGILLSVTGKRDHRRFLGQTTRRAAMRIRTWQPTGQLMAPPPGPLGPPCCVPCCCVVALVSPLLLAAAPVRVVPAAARSRSQPHIATVKHATGPR